jgi:hypothetical protein
MQFRHRARLLFEPFIADDWPQSRIPLQPASVYIARS